MTQAELLTAWREEAERIEPYNQGVARAFRACADALESALREEAGVTYNLRDASREVGVAPRTLARAIGRGELANVGRLHAPRIRRADLLAWRTGVAPLSISRQYADVQRAALTSRVG